MSAVCGWLSTTAGSIALRESLYAYPLVESVHVLTLVLFVGMTIILDLRLMGLILPGVGVREMFDRLLPPIAIGFVIMIISGALLFYANPVRSFHNIFFRLKMLMLVAAGLNAWRFQVMSRRPGAAWQASVPPTRSLKIAGAVSLVLWLGIITAGRMIAYDWFDCDKTPPSLVQWAAGCDGASIE